MVRIMQKGVNKLVTLSLIMRMYSVILYFFTIISLSVYNVKITSALLISNKV